MTPEELRDAVRETIEHAKARGIVPKGAWLKQQLIRRFGAFDETLQGYPSFIAFVKSYSDFLEVMERPKADFIVRLRGEPQLPVPDVPEWSGWLRIRSDLWDAFGLVPVEGTLWVYDRRLDRAVLLRGTPQAEPEPSEGQVPIPKLTANDFKGWVSEFAELQRDPALSSALTQAVQSPNWLASFNTALLQQAPGVQGAWRRFRVQKVLGRIREWAAQQHLSITNVVRRPSRTRVVGEVKGDEVREGRDPVRDRILAILATMPTAELAQIRLPVGLVIDAE